MSKRIELPMALETSGIAKGAKDAERALKNLEDAVGDTGKDGAKDLDKLEDELKDVQRQSEKTERAVDDIGDGGKKSFGRATEATAEFKQEAAANFSEVTSSFDGSMSSIQDLAQGTLGGLASTGLPGVGIAAGIAAIAVGSIGAAMEANDDAAQLNAENIAAWADAYIEAGDKALGAGILAARFQDILTDPEKFKTAETNAKNWGTSVETAIAAMTGNSGAIADVTIALDGQKEAADEAALAAQKLAQENGGQLLSLTAQEQAYLAGAEALSKLTGEMDAGATRAQMLSQYNVDLINSTKDVTKEVDELGNELYSLPDGTQIMIDAETGQATQNVDGFKDDLDGIPETVTTTVRTVVDRGDFDRQMSSMQRRANEGISVVVRPSTGSVWY